MKKNFLILIGVSSLLMSSMGYAHHTKAASSQKLSKEYEITDYYKTIIDQRPYHVQICRDVSVSGDKTGDTLKGALLGGILGKVITGNDDGAKMGALFGSVVGHNESNATGGTKRVCGTEIRYNEEKRSVYSYSIIEFWVGGKRYSVKFKK